MKFVDPDTVPLTYVEVTEQKRLNEAREKSIPWKKWGPYLSERQWGTVREDYSNDGNAWDYFSHDQSRSRADLMETGNARQVQFQLSPPSRET